MVSGMIFLDIFIHTVRARGAGVRLLGCQPLFFPVESGRRLMRVPGILEELYLTRARTGTTWSVQFDGSGHSVRSPRTESRSDPAEHGRDAHPELTRGQFALHSGEMYSLTYW